MKFLIPLFLFSSLTIAGENPTQEQIRLKLWFEGISVKSEETIAQAPQKPLIEEIERPLRKLFSED